MIYKVGARLTARGRLVLSTSPSLGELLKAIISTPTERVNETEITES